jgi:hypothetical protein
MTATGNSPGSSQESLVRRRLSRYVALKQIDRLRLLPQPAPPFVTGGAPISTEDLATGRFTIAGTQIALHTPVNWRQDPFESRSWCYQLNTLTWLKPLLAAHTRLGQRTALELARDIAVDWAAAHVEGRSPNEFAWYDMGVGLRAPYIGYVLRTCLVEGLISDSDAILLLDTAVRHGRELASDDNYAEGHNHGLFQDEGLYLLAEQLPSLDQTANWKEVAVKRLRRTLNRTISFEEGGHLEHSSSYQFSITALVSRLATGIQELPELIELRDRLKATARWHVTPANRMAQLGDTDDIEAPRWAYDNARSLHGMNALFATGQAFVREDGSYLAVTAAHHSSAHKQADETGFLLIENGTVLVGDAGRWGYYEDEPDRRYARSATAHNVLMVDDRDFQWRHTRPYGSGLIAAGHKGSWYAILVENPTLARQGVSHCRLLVYRPGNSLSIADEVIADEAHDYTRHFHFGCAIEAELHNSCVSLSGACTSATLSDPAPDTAFCLHRGLEHPRRLGWAYPGDRIREPVFTAVLRSHATQGLLVTSLAIGEQGRRVASIKRDGRRFSLEYEDGYRLAVALTEGKAIHVEPQTTSAS